MSKTNENDQAVTSRPDPAPAGGGDIRTIEEHAKKLKTDAPVFAAVMQTEQWAAGKKIPEADFKKAVDGFLKAPMGGK